MNRFYLLVFLFVFPLMGISQMTVKDSILESNTHDVVCDCYVDLESTRIFEHYSNGNETCIIYNLSDRDSIVQYYHSGDIASIGIYYGCRQDTVWTETYINKNTKKQQINPNLNTIKTIDSTTYLVEKNYSVTHYPIFKITRFEKNGSIYEKVSKGNSEYIDFKTIKRDKYNKP